MCMPSTSNNDEQHHHAIHTHDDEQGTSASPALACAECFNPVGMEGSARAVLLIPCQHLLHQSCVEYIRRSIKLLRLLRSSRRQHQHGGDDDDDDVASEDDGDDDERGCLNGLSCPACGAPVARLVPLYLPTATEEKKMKTEDDEEEQNNTHVVDVLHATMHAQKKHLSRLRALFDRRRSITDLGRQCATLHHRREHLRREVDELHQLCPAPQPSSSSSSSLMCASLPVDAMNATELQLYLVQTTPMLVRTQNTLRRERELAERQRRQLNLAKQRYFRAKQQHPQASSSSAKTTAPREDEDDTNSSSSTAILMKKLAAHRAAISATRSRDHPLIKRPRSGRGVIDVDEGAPPRRTFPSTDVVDVLSDAEEVVVIDDGDDDIDDDVSRYATAEGSSTSNEDLPEMPLLPLTSGVSVRGASSSAAATSAWTSINPNHIRLLPQRVDRLWQPSLSFDASKSSTTPR